MRRAGTIGAASVWFFVIAGCNAILDNERGILATTDGGSPTEPDPNANANANDGASALPPSTATPDDAALPTDDDAGARPADDAGATTCGPKQHRCAGTCVSDDDPRFGCGAASCIACTLGHAEAACKGGACIISKCAVGWDDCNKAPVDGCETDIAAAANCGTCRSACPATAPVCTASGASYACTTGCAAAAPLLCGTACVDPRTNADHCGGCNKKCPAVANATTACKAGACVSTCAAGFHPCATTCAADTDPLACGTTCARCPTPPNTTAACTAGVCTASCLAGYADCNRLPTDGCESRLADDPANCGSCGSACEVGETCTAGVCIAPPPPPPPPPPP